MKVIKINPKNPSLQLLEEASKIILNQGVIAYPTETVYGLGTNAFSTRGIQRIFELKKRDPSKPLIVIAASLSQVNELVPEIPYVAHVLADAYWPGPLTLILKAASHVEKQLLGPGGSIGIRVPDNKICLELLKLCRVPITSTSANISGRDNSVTADEVIVHFGNRLDLVIDGGIARSRTPSTVLDLTFRRPVLRREGIIPKKNIEQIIGYKLYGHET